MRERDGTVKWYIEYLVGSRLNLVNPTYLESGTERGFEGWILVKSHPQ